MLRREHGLAILCGGRNDLDHLRRMICLIEAREMNAVVPSMSTRPSLILKRLTSNLHQHVTARFRAVPRGIIAPNHYFSTKFAEVQNSELLVLVRSSQIELKVPNRKSVSHQDVTDGALRAVSTEVPPILHH